MAPRVLGNPKIMLLMFVALLLAACGQGGPTPPVAVSSPTEPGISGAATPSPSDTPVLPEPTPTSGIVMAAWVNDEGIPLSVYEAQVERILAAGIANETGTQDAHQLALQTLTDEILLAQSARQNGFSLDDAALQTRIDDLVNAVGGEQALDTWLAANGYTPEEFRQALAQSAAAAWMRDKIAATVPENTPQVHVQQILLDNLNQANQVLAQIRAGTTFASLAARQDPVNAGDLGWFPRGYLAESVLEEAAFALSAGETSEVIETSLGFHILQVIEVSDTQPLAPDARLVLRKKAVQDWLTQQRSQSEIRTLVP